MSSLDKVKTFSGNLVRQEGFAEGVVWFSAIVIMVLVVVQQFGADSDLKHMEAQATGFMKALDDMYQNSNLTNKLEEFDEEIRWGEKFVHFDKIKEKEKLLHANLIDRRVTVQQQSLQRQCLRTVYRDGKIRHCWDRNNKECSSGFAYNGTKTTTLAGKKCNNWETMLPKKLKLQLKGNTCRNPNGDPRGPWCYAYHSGGAVAIGSGILDWAYSKLDKIKSVLSGHPGSELHNTHEYCFEHCDDQFDCVNENDMCYKSATRECWVPSAYKLIKQKDLNDGYQCLNWKAANSSFPYDDDHCRLMGKYKYPICPVHIPDTPADEYTLRACYIACNETVTP